jgi:hypothetical protein
LQLLKELHWPFVDTSVSLATHSPALTFLHVAEADERTPVRWADALITIPHLRHVRWRSEKRLEPKEIHAYFQTVNAARTRIQADRAKADAEQAKSMAARNAAKAAAVASIAPPEQTSHSWYRGSTSVKRETADEISQRIRREYRDRLVKQALETPPTETTVPSDIPTDFSASAFHLSTPALLPVLPSSGLPNPIAPTISTFGGGFVSFGGGFAAPSLVTSTPVSDADLTRALVELANSFIDPPNAS